MVISFPVGLCALKMTHALLAGNCLIIKVPPTAPCAAIKLVELGQSVLPPGVLSVLYGGNDLYAFSSDFAPADKSSPGW